MTIKLSYANQKGGVGKSTITMHTAFEAHQRGIRTLVVDMDGQGNTSTKIAGRQAIEELSDTITKTYQLFHDDLSEVQVLKCKNGIDLIPARINDDELYSMEAADLRMVVNPARNLASIEDEYDLIIIDCPPSLGRLLSAGLIMASHVVMPVQVSGFALDGVGGLFRLIETIQKGANPNLEIVGILVNCYNARSGTHKQSVEALRAKVNDLVLKNIIGNRSSIDQAVNMSKPVWSFRSGAARKAAQEMQAAIHEIFERAGVSA
ncbi:AAA family ATPase [Halomonas shantousis]